MNWYLAVLKKYAEFSGRARRKEFWYFFLINLIISTIIGVFEGAMAASTGGSSGTGVVGMVYNLALLLPGIAVGVRRMHDIGKSGWYSIIPIYNLFLFATEGDKGENEYGADPKGEDMELSDHLVED